MESRPYSSCPSSPLQARGTSALLLHQSPWCSTPFSATPVQFHTGKPQLNLCLMVLCLGCRTDPILHFDSQRMRWALSVLENVKSSSQGKFSPVIGTLHRKRWTCFPRIIRLTSICLLRYGWSPLWNWRCSQLNVG